MKSIATMIFALLFVIGGAVAQEVFAKSELVIVTKDGPQIFQIEIATTPGQQAQGLMYRRTLAAGVVTSGT
ncbi:MAG: hypothetical protein CFH40_01741, partial [Alphaproteobacteria bacterium MarineAlpha10_Bin3]